MSVGNAPAFDVFLQHAPCPALRRHLLGPQQNVAAWGLEPPHPLNAALSDPQRHDDSVGNNPFTNHADGGQGGGTVSEICNGFDDDLNGQVDENCACKPGATQSCFPGRQGGVKGICKKGQQTCGGTSEFGSWGPCSGAVTPVAEICGDGVDQDCDGADLPCSQQCTPTVELCNDGVDNDCDGKKDCADPDCAKAPACLTQKCQGGQVKITDLWYCKQNCPGGVGVASAESLPKAAAWNCGKIFGSGGWLRANCAGTYNVCAAVKNSKSKAVCRQVCVTVTVKTDGATVQLPHFPGFVACNACAIGAGITGGHTCIRVTGKTVYGTGVNKEIYCGWHFINNGTAGGGGSGSGGW